MPAILQPVRKLAGGSGFTGTLQSGHQNDGGRLRTEFELGRVLAQHFDQFVANDLDDLFARCQSGHHVLAQRLVLDLVNELLDDFEVDVGFQQRQPDLLQCVLDIVFIEDSLAAEHLKRSL